MLNLLAVACGGAVGALGRYWLSGVVYRQLGAGFPYGTLAVNVLGSLLMGVVLVQVQDRDLPEVWRMALAVGVLGAFTTFSTFSLEALLMLQTQRYGAVTAYAVGSVVLCIAGAFVGYRLGEMLR